ncbi:AzlC family ABC transporter permease [Salinarimonas ramus]|uniref:AzlC family protein n=1 Tax=Salinarimonas ramus TaxID=690164 RepID=A0A917QFJ0_9HYPH|nr:AzlC family ABC transporter permease [Salinarimonas ramus]GGK48142.1 AzlC family protein [Salinarimonas ramus]
MAEPAPDAGPAAATHSLVWRGARDALALPAWVVGFALVGVGSLAQGVGYPLGATMLSTLLIWAGPAQVVFFGSLAAGVALPLIAAAICLSSIRFLPMTIALMPLLRRPGQGLLAQIAIAHYIAVTVWVESLRRLPSMPAQERLPYYLGFANACILTTTALTGVGWFLSGTLPAPLASGLLFITPVYFTIALAAGARTAVDVTAIVLGFLLAPLFGHLVGRDFDLLFTGLVGGTIAYLAGRARRRRKA